MVKNLISSMSSRTDSCRRSDFRAREKVQTRFRLTIGRGYLFGKKITTGNGNNNEENFQMGGDTLGDGFSLPQYRRTYLNAALLNDPQNSNLS